MAATVVDCERHRPIDLRPDRSAETSAARLRRRPQTRLVAATFDTVMSTVAGRGPRPDDARSFLDGGRPIPVDDRPEEMP